MENFDFSRFVEDVMINNDRYVSITFTDNGTVSIGIYPYAETTEDNSEDEDDV